jgi:hypothetical protein
MARTCKACYLKDKNVALTCVVCEKDFVRPTSEHTKNARRHGEAGQTFCSKACYEHHRATRPSRVTPLTGACKTCGAAIAAEKRYCSMECYGSRKAKTVEYTGKWSAFKHAVKKRDKGICGYCGKEHQRVAVHHIDHNASNNVMSNLLTLCDPCHNHYHHRTSGQLQEIIKQFFREKAAGS